MREQQDQPTLWNDEPEAPTRKEWEPIGEVTHSTLGVSGNNPGYWHRVPYQERYQPTPGQMTGRDCYNAWCTVLQENIERMRASGTYSQHDIDRMERDLWRWTREPEDMKKQYERMAEILREDLSDHPPERARFCQRYGYTIQAEDGSLRFGWTARKKEA